MNSRICTGNPLWLHSPRAKGYIYDFTQLPVYFGLFLDYDLVYLYLQRQSVLDFAQANLFTPLGINKVKWEVRKDGNNDGSGLGLWMPADALLKIGQLMLNKGIWNGQQLVSEQWIKKSLNPALKSKAAFGLPRSKHGYCWYATERNEMQVHYGMGYGGQFIFLFPSEDLVIVTTHNHDTADGIPQQVQFVTQYLPSLVANYRN